MLFESIDICTVIMQIIQATSLASPLISKTTVNTAYGNQGNEKLKQIPNIVLVNAFYEISFLQKLSSRGVM